MRDIKFRGKTLLGKWIYGYFFIFEQYPKIFTIEHSTPYNVDIRTVGQFTGLHDKEGTEIYEGDILEFVGGTCHVLTSGCYARHKIGAILQVTSLASGFTLSEIGNNSDTPNIIGNINNYVFWNNQRSLKVIGNIHTQTETK